MTYWGDILDAEDKLNGDFDIEAPHKDDPIKLLTFKAKHNPNKDTSVSMNVDVSAAKEGDGLAFKNKREVKRNEGEYDYKGTWTSKDESWEANWRPADLNKDGNETTFTHTGKFTPNVKEHAWEGNVGVQTGGFEIGPIKPYVGLQFDTNNKKEHTVEITNNFVYEKDFHVGSATTIDVNNKSLQTAYGVLAWKNQEWGAAWLRSNCLSRFVGVGWSGKAGGYNHTLEVQYDASKDAKTGFQGLPLWIRHGAALKFANGSSAKVATRLGENVRVQGSVTLPVQDNLSVTLTDRLNVDEWIRGNKDKAGYQFGAGIEFKL